MGYSTGLIGCQRKPTINFKLSFYYLRGNVAHSIDEVRIWPSFLDAIVLGPVWSVFASPLIGFMMVKSAITNDDMAALLAIAVMLLAPLITLCAVPIIKLWLRSQTGGYWGAVVIGGVVGTICVFTFALFDGPISNLNGLIIFIVLAGIPFGSAYASAFWISLNQRATDNFLGPRWSKPNIAKALSITLAFVLVPQVILLLWTYYHAGSHG
ncbi:hypothetical protein O2N63_16220 [Aliiroseovarius sp. KMU-50]|uniref:Uncharacterized protein n=1 Tax=Aliiroseovarius salicola TaxID=3009082 RepID=A0ABT4W537_9RHOB|nr:hypothetical protein [Aliiroseovarius sp. KMU-50]MDA5095637.1 hypothetical protein [Aliiroseovarius sp. KMU-50]